MRRLTEPSTAKIHQNFMRVETKVYLSALVFCFADTYQNVWFCFFNFFYYQSNYFAFGAVGNGSRSDNRRFRNFFSNSILAVWRSLISSYPDNNQHYRIWSSGTFRHYFNRRIASLGGFYLVLGLRYFV